MDTATSWFHEPWVIEVLLLALAALLFAIHFIGRKPEEAKKGVGKALERVVKPKTTLLVTEYVMMYLLVCWIISAALLIMVFDHLWMGLFLAFVVSVVFYGSLSFMVNYSATQMSSKPPSFAIPLWWGTPEGIVISKPRLVFSFKRFPIWESLNLFDKVPTTIPQRTTIVQVRAPREFAVSDDDPNDHFAPTPDMFRSGGRCEVRYTVTTEPNTSDFKSASVFVSNGEEAGVRDQLPGIIDSFLREVALDSTLNEFLSQTALTALLLTHLTGLEPTKKVEYDVVKGKKKPKRNFQVDAPPFVAHEMTPEEREQDFTKEDLVVFIFETLRGKKAKDIMGLGVIITKLNIDEVNPLGKAAEVQDSETVEVFKRYSALRRADTVIRTAQSIMRRAKEAGQDISWETAMDQARVITLENAREFQVRGVGGNIDPEVAAAAMRSEKAKGDGKGKGKK